MLFVGGSGGIVDDIVIFGRWQIFLLRCRRRLIRCAMNVDAVILERLFGHLGNRRVANLCKLLDMRLSNGF